MTCNRTNLTGANLHWAELAKMYETFVRTVELAGKQLLSSRMVLINCLRKKITSIFLLNHADIKPFSVHVCCLKKTETFQRRVPQLRYYNLPSVDV